MGQQGDMIWPGRSEEIQRQMGALRKELTQIRASVANKVVGEYQFARPDGSAVSLGALFGPHRELLIVHNMGERCSYCALWADGFIGFSRHIQERCGFVLASPDSPESLQRQIAARGWNYPVVSENDNGFSRAMGFEPEPGKRWPGISSFKRDADGTIYRQSAAHFGPGDEFCSIWHLFDLLHDGPAGWEPKRL